MTSDRPMAAGSAVAHEAHDRIAVAAYACGDAEGAELATAAALVAECAECASLHRDLRSIATATAATPAPVRPRDFRITEAQAARLRPAGWRRLLAPFASPRFAFAGPLGGGLAAIGLAGVLVAGGIGIPFGAGGSAAAPAMATEAPAGDQEVKLNAATEGTGSTAAGQEAPAASSDTTAMGMATQKAQPAPDGAAPAPAASGGQFTDPQAPSAPAPGDAAAAPEPVRDSASDSQALVMSVAWAALLLGLALLVLRRIGRQAADLR